MLAIFGMVALNYAHSAERFRESSAHIGVDLAALPKDRANRCERLLQSEREDRDADERDHGHAYTDADQNDECQHRRQQTAQKIDESGADQVAHAFHIGEDARHHRSRFGRIVVSNWKTSNVLLNLPPHIGNQPLRRLREQLSQSKGGDALNHGGCDYSDQDLVKPPDMLLHDHVIDQELRGCRQHQTRHCPTRCRQRHRSALPWS